MSHALQEVRLDDKYNPAKIRALLNGNQALVRALLVQRERDRAAGLKSAGYVSGYRGSPLGGLDQALWASRSGTARARAWTARATPSSMATTWARTRVAACSR